MILVGYTLWQLEDEIGAYRVTPPICLQVGHCIQMCVYLMLHSQADQEGYLAPVESRDPFSSLVEASAAAQPRCLPVALPKLIR